MDSAQKSKQMLTEKALNVIQVLKYTSDSK